ncbi:3D domain-containing protein [Paradesulfitobacterium ferrireducens]|uniref:3D domain-containing protein n=1 Tax=Paradesulfitobacterium ferrireducens TaxID=2816476 RepID=UPI001A904A10|nr:3D domain-containing protein [Paradesulfitobacterium ferrireducens]
MLGQTRIRVMTLVRRFGKVKLALAGLAFLALLITPFLLQLKSIEVEIDGQVKSVRTIFSTVGGALEHTRLGIYPEDAVVPSRETRLSQGMVIHVTRSVPVKLSVDGKTYEGRTVAATVGEALKDLSERYQLDLKEVDEVNYPRTDTLPAGTELAVRRSIPVKVQADGKEYDTYMAPRPVAEALAKLNLTLGALDKVSLPLDHILEPNDRVQVVRVVEKIEQIKTEIPYQTVAQPANFPVGLPDKVVKRGANGVQEQTIKLVLEDGKEVDRQVLAQRVALAPVNQVVSRGTQTSISRGGTVVNFKRAYQMRATAYCEPGGRTATGTPVRWGIVAVDPRVIPLGSKVYVEGYGQAEALDVGGAIKGNKIDVYMDSEEAARSWGVRSVIVYVQ